jgi:hypothetical protein
MAELTGQLCVSFRLSDSECLPGDLSVVILADRSSAQIHHGTEEETPLPRCFPSPTKENECAHCALQQRHQRSIPRATEVADAPLVGHSLSPFGPADVGAGSISTPRVKRCLSRAVRFAITRISVNVHRCFCGAGLPGTRFPSSSSLPMICP